MKHLLVTTIAAVVLVGCGPSVDIHQAAERGNIEAVKQAIADGADVNAKTGKKPRIACLGLAFKPDIDDLRESPALEVAEALSAQGYDAVAVEPNITSHDVFELLSVDSALEDSDVIAVLVKHREFLRADVRERLIRVGALDFCGALA